ncbi:MAG: hypothetical protein N3D85_01255 [Candidatus Bathyarchaeota archaeon]|nr:hypothetical protein [Candidatus Bathyarchaeota archaeon]
MAIQNTLNELRNICPQISTAYIFKPDKTVLAQDKDANKSDVASTVDKLCMLIKHARVGGGLEFFRVDSLGYCATVTRLGSVYFAMVHSRALDDKVLCGITRGIVPIVLKLVELIQPELMYATPQIFEDFPSEKAQMDSKERSSSEVVGSEKNVDCTSFSESVVSQLTVENLNGISRLVGSQDNVRVDPAIINQWVTLGGQKEIIKVEVEEIQSGKKIVCNFKPIKDVAFYGKAVIQLSEKIQTTLQTKRGAAVLVRPIIK